MRHLFSAVLFVCFSTSVSQAADISSLKNIFRTNFNGFYVQSRCGNNIVRFVNEAVRLNIDLSNSYVMKVVGSGFLETSGFYTRGQTQERAMLGYFHMVFVADDYVFDFDLDEPFVLKIEDYVRLQFTPPYQPFYIFGVNFDPLRTLSWWTMSRYEWATYIKSNETITWTKKMGEILDLTEMMKKERYR